MKRSQDLTTDEITESCNATDEFIGRQLLSLDSMKSELRQYINNLSPEDFPSAYQTLSQVHNCYERIRKDFQIIAKENSAFRESSQKTSTPINSADEFFENLSKELRVRMISMEPGDSFVIRIGMPEDNTK